MRPIPPLVLVWAAALGAASPALGQSVWYGPLTTEEGSPLQRLTYTAMTEAADPVPRGHVRTEFWLGYSNVFERDSTAAYDLYFDLERLISTAGVRYGVSDRLEVGGRLTFETTGGGALDDFLTWWHGVLHVPNADRDKYPSDIHRQRLLDGSGQVRIDVPSRTLALEDVRLFAKARVLASDDRRKVLALRAVARVPTQGSQIGTERADVAVAALGRISWERWHLHAMLGRSTVRASPELRDILAESAWFTSWALERRVTDAVSGLLQYTISSPRLEGFESVKIRTPPGNFVFGVAGRLGPRWRWDVSFQEDIPPLSPAVDFTLGVRLSRSW